VHLGASGRLPDRLPEVLNDEADRPLPDLPQTSIRRTVRPAISPSEVKIYLQPPPSFEEVAILNASAGSVFGTGGQGSADKVIQRLKEQAAKLGANGIILEGMDARSLFPLGQRSPLAVTCASNEVPAPKACQHRIVGCVCDCL
jgi:hypothetical protein